MDELEFLSNWNSLFVQHQLQLKDFKDPHKFIGAMLEVCKRLDIDCDAIVSAPPEAERDEHSPYYWDLNPIINMIRVVNHFTGYRITIADFLQPLNRTSVNSLYILINLMCFFESQRKEISPHEEDLFEKREQMLLLEQRKSKLQELLNEQAIEKAKRSDRLKEIDHDIKLFEEELKQEKEAHDEEKQALEAILKENQQLEVIIDHKRAHRDALVTEVTRKRALRVYDANDIKAQAEQASQNVQEAEDKLESLKEALILKETSLKNLKNIKPNFDSANNLLHDIMKITDSLKEQDLQACEPDTVEGELDAVQAELKDAQTHLAELRHARSEYNATVTEGQSRRQEQRAIAISALEEAEQRDKKNRDKSEKAILRVQEIKNMTAKYEEQKNAGVEQLMLIKNQFYSQLKTFSDALLDKATETSKEIESKLNRTP